MHALNAARESRGKSRVVRVVCSIVLAGILAMNGCSKDNVTSNATGITEKSGSSITGIVLPAVSGAKILLTQGRPIDSVFSDPADGYFKLNGIGPGSYHLCIIAAQCDTFTCSISVQPDYAYDYGRILLADKTKGMSDTIPSVYDHYPADNAELIYLPPDQYSQGSARLYVSVSFDRPMNRESVEKALSISPTVDGGYFEWFQNTRKFTPQQPSSYYWNGNTLYDSVYSYVSYSAAMAPDIVVSPLSTVSASITSYSVVKSFTFYFPRSSCFTDTTYTVKISRSAVDTAGTPLDSALEFSFRTMQSALSYEGIQMLPHSGDDWVALINNGLQLIFPRRMEEASTDAAITVSVGAKPVFLWQDYNHLTLYTGGIFVPDTLYTITIGAGAADVDGKPLGTADTLRFKTAPIRISSSVPTRGQIGFPSMNSMYLTFNTYMDRTSVAKFSALVSGSGDTIAGNYGYVAYGYYNATRGAYDSTYVLNRIIFTPATTLTRNTFYTLTIGAGTKDLGGYPMKEPYEIAFITAP